ncbi:MAG TPA: cupredoxin family copper-binding protein [Candidatus Limnocylindrales bacterium]|nr:cupredoxin family copper-binding protein [Candidatus Limnocylindrales bacterium]
MTRRIVPASLAGVMLLLPTLAAGAAGAQVGPIVISGFAYDPPTQSATVGDVVSWRNDDGVTHTATADDASWDTGNIAAGGTGQVTFTAAGTFAYHCTIHPAMTGTLVVSAATPGTQAPATRAPATQPPTDAAASAPRGESGPALPIALAAGLLGLVAASRRFRRSAG